MAVRTVGFVEEVEIEELCSLAVPVIDDVGSGALAPGVPELADEPPVRRSVAAGCAATASCPPSCTAPATPIPSR